jgi:hypothetical protein
MVLFDLVKFFYLFKENVKIQIQHGFRFKHIDYRILLFVFKIQIHIYLLHQYIYTKVHLLPIKN